MSRVGRMSSSSSRKKVLVYLATGEEVSSYSSLEQILSGLGWERYYGRDPNLFQFHKQSSIDLISLPKDFSKFNTVHMYDIVVKNPNMFHVRDMSVSSNQCAISSSPPPPPPPPSSSSFSSSSSSSSFH